MNSVSLLVFLTASVIAGVPPHTESEGQNRVLEGYFQCIGRKSLLATEVVRRPEFPQFRVVRVAESMRAVSVISGYSVKFSDSDGRPVLTAKFEISKSSSAAADRDVVRAQMRSMSNARSAEALPLRESAIKGTEILALHQAGSGHEIVSFFSVFVPAKSVIATFYMLRPDGNSHGEGAVSDMEKYRDAVMDEVISCMTSS